MGFIKLSIESKAFKITLIIILVSIILTGVLLRFYKVNEDIFIYYDEGMWLNSNMPFLRAVDTTPPKSIGQIFKFLTILFKLSLISGKALWSFIAGLRAFFLSADSWYFVRVVSAFFGSLTLLVEYFISKKIFKSSLAALFTVSLLAVFPSHVFYSRIGLQEATSAFFFILGIYFYLFETKVNIKLFISGLLFSLVYFTNYRMIIIPVIILFIELFIWTTTKRKPCFQKYFASILTFLFIVILIGNIKIGNYTNSYVTFSWMFRQKQLADGTFNLVNLLSFPYYLFRLESVFFGFAFFANIYFIFKKQYEKLLAFATVCFLMLIFSLSQEKGVRYLCVVMPLMVIAVSQVFIELFKSFKNKISIVVFAFVSLMIMNQLFISVNITKFRNDYMTSVKELKLIDNNAKILSSQNMIQALFVNNAKDVIQLEKDFSSIINYYLKGYKYIIIDPQAYIYLANNKRFDLRLTGVLEFIKKTPPLKKYSHFNHALLERFVFEHNENLITSINFLKANKSGELGNLIVYDLEKALSFLKMKSKI